MAARRCAGRWRWCREATGRIPFARGEEEEGEATMCEAIDLARSGGHQDVLASVFSNLADAQHRAGRSREGLATAIAGQAEVAAGQRSRRWLGLERAEIAFALGDWEQAESELLPRPGAFSRSALLSWDMNRAELALGRGDLAAARPLLDETAELVENSIEPHYLAGHGVLRA